MGGHFAVFPPPSYRSTADTIPGVDFPRPNSLVKEDEPRRLNVVGAVGERPFHGKLPPTS